MQRWQLPRGRQACSCWDWTGVAHDDMHKPDDGHARHSQECSLPICIPVSLSDALPYLGCCPPNEVQPRVQLPQLVVAAAAIADDLHTRQGQADVGRPGTTPPQAVGSSIVQFQRVPVFSMRSTTMPTVLNSCDIWECVLSQHTSVNLHLTERGNTSTSQVCTNLARTAAMGVKMA